ncbi:MAG: hypothetical protein JRE58_03815 [Deltaproteobacteria bacterium]|nr:hypothetical protein [Deltaproteobacteria bacterium]
MQAKISKLVYTALFVIAVLACSCNQRGLDINVRFDRIGGLAKGCPVIFDSKVIGSVSELGYEKNENYIVKLAIKPEFSNAATEYSRFFIVADPADPRKKAVEMSLFETDGRQLKNNATINGSDTLLLYSEKIQKDLEKGLNSLKKEYQKMIDNLQQLPEQEKFKLLEEELRQLLEQMKKSSAATREKLKQEVLPQFRQELEKLRKTLRDFGREKELEPLEDQIREIGSI